MNSCYSEVERIKAVVDASYDNLVEKGIIRDREQRKRDLVGKYVVIVTSRYQPDLDLFLQDNDCGSGHWTKFIENARGFCDESAAIVKAKNLQYNNPRVAIMQSNGRLREVYSNGKRTR